MENPGLPADPALIPPVEPAPGSDTPPAGPPPAPPRRSDRSWIAPLAIAAALTLLISGAGAGWVAARSVRPAAPATPSAEAPIRSVPQTLPGTAGQGTAGAGAQAVAAKVIPAVVDINTVVAGGQAAGTGMILTSGGEVLTNNHVVEGATRIAVTIGGGAASHAAHVIGVDPSADVALIQIEGVSGLPTVTLASSSTLTVGQAVIAIGNRLGRGGSPAVTEGTITALDQSITAGDGGGSAEQLSGLIQTDAPISPGDSGGPLVNTSGQVVGMITAGSTQGFRRRAASTRQGYAVSSNAALDVANLIRSGQTGSGIVIGQPGFLGVQVRTLDANTAAQLGLSISAGALVTEIVPDSPAAQAGISRNSVITAIDGTAIASAEALGPAIRSHQPGQPIQVGWVDSGGRHTATVTLTGGPAA